MIQKRQGKERLRWHFEARREFLRLLLFFFFKKVWLFQIKAVPLHHEKPPSLFTMLKSAGRFFLYNEQQNPMHFLPTSRPLTSTQWASLVVGRANRYGNRHNYTRRARMEIRHPRPILLEKYPKIKKFEFEPENNRISALHFLHLNCIINV
ncbi:hypothetical protein SAMN05444375_11064 [Segatella baroniae B14]|nr:hypothetical protein SAMN05444375_11064 [Segatella baroniae B14]